VKEKEIEGTTLKVCMSSANSRLRERREKKGL